MNSVLGATGVAHIALVCDHFDDTIAFYERLGAVRQAGWGEGNRRIQLMELAGGTCVELFAWGDGTTPPSGRWVHVALAVEDVEAAYHAALAAGAKPKNPPRVVEIDSTIGKRVIHCAFVFGPEGEELEFFRFQ